MEHFEELIAMEEGSNDGNEFDDRTNEVTEIVDVEENSSRLVRFEHTAVGAPLWTGTPSLVMFIIIIIFVIIIIIMY